jgi:hypothetical protein
MRGARTGTGSCPCVSVLWASGQADGTAAADGSGQGHCAAAWSAAGTMAGEIVSSIPTVARERVLYSTVVAEFFEHCTRSARFQC